MDIEELIEEGARAFQKVHDPDEHWDTYPEHWKALCRVRARAVIATMLKAIVSEEANITTGDILLAGGEMTAQELRTVKAVLNWRLSNLRALAEQVEKANG